MTWVPGDQPTDTGFCFLLQESGDRLLQENGCRIIIDISPNGEWIEGDRYTSNPVANGCCDDGNGPTHGNWSIGDNTATNAWTVAD